MFWYLSCMHVIDENVKRNIELKILAKGHMSGIVVALSLMTAHS